MANYFDGKVTPNSPQSTDLDRYQNLGLRDTEPNLGIPEDDGYVLSSDTLGNRVWVPSGMGPTTPFIPKDIITAKGDIIIGSSPDTPTVITVAPDGCILITDSTDFVGVKWLDFAQLGVPLSLFSAKGDLAVATSSGVVTNVTVGVDGQVLVADSAEPSGVKWGTVTGSGIPETIIEAKGDLIAGVSSDTPQRLPVGSNGHVLMADSAEPLGVKWAPTGAIETLTVVTEVLTSGQDWDFWLDLGQLFSFISVTVTASSEDGWLRVYTSDAARAADTRIAPGPPLPAINAGYVTEVVTTPSEPSVTLLPIPQAFTEDGVFFRFTNQSLVTQSFSLEFRIFRVVESPCDLPPYGNNVYVNPGCVQYFSTITGVLSGGTPSLIYSGGTTLLGEASNTYLGFLVGGSGTLGEFTLDRGALGEISSIIIYSGSGYNSGDTVVIEGSLIGGNDGVDDVEISLSRFNGMELLGAWENGGSITTFPLLNVSQGVEFIRAWYNCSSMTSIQLLDVSSATDFTSSWGNCASLTDFPLINTSSGINFSFTWDSCSSLTSFPLLDVSSGIDFTYAWSNCASLTSFPALSADQGVIFEGTWANCSGLTSFPLVDVSLGENFSYAWAGCSGLTSFPSLNTASGTKFTGSWSGCSGLTSFPLLDVSSGIEFGATYPAYVGAWSECSGLTSFPLLDVSSGVDFSHVWRGCSSLTSFPALNFSNGLNFTESWQNCTSLTSFPAGVFDSCLATNFIYAWSGCALDQTSVDNILVSLDTAGQLNGIVNLDGGTSAEPGVAGYAAKASLEGKGWTVLINTVIFTYCTPDYPLLPVTYPPYSCNTTVNTTGVTDFSNAWDGCYAITSFPCVDSSAVTNFSYAWNGCSGLTSFPYLNTGVGTDFTYTWAYSGITSFPNLDFTSGGIFYGTWKACYYMASFPTLNLGNGTDFSYAWYKCTSLTTLPSVDLSLGTSFIYSWAYSGLTSFPGLTLSSGLDFYGTWSGCYYITSFPALNLGAGTDFTYAWWSCTGLTSMGLVDVSSGTSFTFAWSGCSSLTSFPAIDVSSGTDFSHAWQFCSSLTSFPVIDVSSGTDFSYAWQNCTSLTSFPLLNVTSGNDFQSAWYNCTSLTSFPAGMFDSCITSQYFKAWQNCALDQTSVDNILVSIDNSGQLVGQLNLDGGTSSAPGVAGAAAKASLIGKGWTVLTN